MPSASSKNVRAGGAYVEFFAKDGALDASLRRIGSKLKNFGMSATMMGAGVSAIGAAATAPFAIGVQTYATFEASMARVKALTKSNTKEYDALELKARELGATTVFSATQAAEAMQYFALAGFSVDEILTSVGPTLELAAAGQIGIAEAADISSKLMAGMGIEAKDLANSVDVLAKAMSTANTDVPQLGEAFKYVGPLARASGMSLEETTAAIQLLSNAGVQGEMAGTSLRGMLLSLTSPTKEAQGELDRLGVKVIDTAGKIRPLHAIIGDLETALADVGNGEKMKSIGTIFPARQAAGVEILISQGADALREKTTALADATGTAARISATQLDTIKGDQVIAESAAEGMFIALGKIFAGSVRGTTQFVTFLINKTTEFIDQNQSLVFATGALAVGVLGLGMAITGLGFAAVAAGIAFTGLSSIYGIFAGLVSFSFSPLALVIGAIAAVVYWSGAGGAALSWLVEQFGPLAQIAQETFAAIQTAISNGNWEAAGNALWAALKLAWVKGVNTINSIWRAASGEVVETWKGTVDILSAIWSGLIASVSSKLATAQNETASWIIEKQRQVGILSNAEAAGAQEELTLMGQEAQKRIFSKNSEAQRSIEAEAEKRREAARQADALAMSESAKSLAQAQAEYDAAMKAATESKPAAEGSTPGSGKTPTTNLTKLSETLAPTIARTGGVGSGITLSAMASRMFSGGDDPAKATAKNTEKMTKQMQKIIDENLMAPDPQLMVE